MTLDLVRLDDRLVHGQVVVGWGQALAASLVIVMDDRVRQSEWEQELYRMGMPPHMSLEFASVEEAVAAVPRWLCSSQKTLLLTGDVDSLVRLVEGAPAIRRVNVGGLHQQPDRRQRLRYLYLSETEAEQLRRLAERGVEVSVQDVPTARPIPFREIP
ncbi:MAG: PTS sugar transporter subunit IIB [Gemmatimonadetes bacterium]|nr:PTS sugar transporter subunit IIB [Gemmatimonadota bacterium]